MSTETTQNFAELIGTSALRGALAGLRGVTSPDVPYPSPKAEPAELAYAATVGFIGEQAEHASLKAAKDAAKLQIEDAIRSAIPGSDRARDLADLKDRLDSAKSPGEISALLAAVANASAQTAAPETPAQKADRLWNEIKKGNQEITTDLEELHKRKLISDKEYEDLIKERERLDKLDPNDPERLRGERAYTQRVQNDAKNAEQVARSNGDNTGEEKAQKTVTDTENQKKRYSDLQDATNITATKPTEKFSAHLANDDVRKHLAANVTLSGVTSASADASNSALPAKAGNTNPRNLG